MILKELTLINWLSHENTKINFSKNEKLLIDGCSGSGKSSITEAILWVLYGKGRSENRFLIRRGCEKATVILRLVDEGQVETLINRTISKSGKNILNVTRNVGGEGQFLAIETTGLKDTQNWIEKELIKASYELFTNSIAYPQENENSFVKASASRRKDLLLEIVGASSFDELYEKAKKLISTLESDNAVKSSKISLLEESIKKNKEIADKLKSYEEKYHISTEQIKTLELIESDLESQLQNISNITTQLNNNKRIIKVLADSISSINTQLEINNQLEEEYNKLKPEELLKDIEESNKLYEEIEKIEIEIKNNNEISNIYYNHMANKPQVFDYSKDIKEINERLDPLLKDNSRCPAGDACPWITPIQGQIKYLKEQILDRENKSASEKIALEKWEEIKVSPLKDSTVLYQTLKDIQSKYLILSKSKDIYSKYLGLKDGLVERNTKQVSLKKERDERIKEITDNENEIKLLEEKLEKFDINTKNIDLANIRISKQELQKTRDESFIGKQMAINAENELKEASTALIELDSSLKKTIEDYESIKLLKEALSPRGLKATIVDYLIPQLEERINDVLSQMSDFKIRLDTQTIKADEEGVKEGLFITVKNPEGQEMSYESFSGGEKIKITIAISEALASLLQNNIGFRIMDENIISLDTESTQNFSEVLLKLQEKFPQLLIISHINEIKDLFEKKITIIKTNGVSKIT
jgi:exonuclease SbcC